MAHALDPEETETRVIHALVDFDGKDVLEIGCGDGRLTWRHAAKAGSVLAIDPKAGEIKKARKETPADLRAKVRFEVGDITTFESPAGAFDVAVFAWSL